MSELLKQLGEKDWKIAERQDTSKQDRKNFSVQAVERYEGPKQG